MKALPEAHLVHHAFGRTRVRIPSRKGDLSYFEELGRTIESSEAVRDFVLNARLGSVLLLHQMDLDALHDFGENHELFVIVPSGMAFPKKRDSIAKQAADKLDQMDGRLKKISLGTLDLNSVSFLGLIGLGAFQILRGQILPPAGTLFQMASNSLKSARQETSG